MACAAESAIYKTNVRNLLLEIGPHIYLKMVKKKVKIALEQAVKAQSGSTGIDLFFL
jgi:hypothetical protein